MTFRFKKQTYLHIIYDLLEPEIRIRAHSTGSRYVRPKNLPSDCQAVYSIYDSIVKEGIQHVLIFFR